MQEYLASFDQEPGYLNWGGFGPLSATVRAEVRADMELLSSGRPSGMQLVAEHRVRATQALSRLTGFREDQLVLQPSSGAGMQQVIYGLQGGVMLSRREFPSMTTSVARAAAALGTLQVQWLDPVDGIVTPERLADELTDTTRAVVVSHVDFRTGARIDLDDVRDVIGDDRLLIVDAVQSFGVMTGAWTAADALVGHGYKWMRCGRGTGFLAVSDRGREQITPVLSSFGGLADFPGESVGTPAAGAAAYLTASTDQLAVARFAASLAETEAAGVVAIETAIAARVDEALALLERADLVVSTPTERSRRAGMLTVVPAPGELSTLTAALANAGLVVTGREGTVRFSFHAGTDADTMRMLSDALAAFAQQRDRDR